MKRFRFATIHLVMIGLIIFGLLAICVRLFRSETAILLAIFLALAFMVALLHQLNTQADLSEQELIEGLNERTEASLKTLLEQMPVGVVQFNARTGQVDWYNPYAALIFSDEQGDFASQVVMDLIAQRQEKGASNSFEVASTSYNSYLDQEAGIFYFMERSKLNRSSGDATLMQSVIGVVSADNYDEVTDDLSDAETSHINSFIANFVGEFAKSKQIFYRRVTPDRFYLVTDYAVLTELIEDKFSLLEEFRKQAKEADLPLTLSMGLAYGESDHYDLGQIALENLNTALVRGGDQAVVRENSDFARPLYFGGGSVSKIKRSRTRTRAMMTAISDRLKNVDKVFIVGHKKLDLDALGSSVGMQFFAQNLGVESYVVYDPYDMASDINLALSRLTDDGKTSLLTVEEAKGLVSPRSLLIMVDHSKLSLTLSRELYDLFTDVIVVDHHRRDDDFPENAVLTFIESGASSASELVTELIQFQHAKEKISKIQASVLMAGIMLDTKSFTSGVTSRTFDVASYLRSQGSNSQEIQQLTSTDFDEYRLVNELILRGKRLAGNIVIARGADKKVYNNVIASKAADTMLALAGIEASFVISKNQNNQTAISARSRSKVNVQKIMEELGGGGHFTFAACQLSDMTPKQAEQALIKVIESYLENDKGE